jgi:hypothetical protein
MNTRVVEFEGINSGDGEAFCWDVDAETYKSIRGIESYNIEIEDRESMEPWESSPEPAPWRIYPSDLLPSNVKFQKKKLRIKIESEIIEDYTNGM